MKHLDIDASSLDLETMVALRGTDDLRKRLLLELSNGTPSITDLAYAVKIRVKEDYKLVEKVTRKREFRPAYQVSDVRDIVGVRVVTLYRLDALDILPILLEKIEAGRHDITSVFTPQGIEEIIIYSTNPEGDAQGLPHRVAALCDSFDLKEKTRIENTPQNYSSIHIVVWCRGKYRSEYKSIPVEIQVRTAFEDVWGEIDHSLKYKRDDKSINKNDEGRIQINDAHLNVLKTLIDGLAQYGDQIKIQLDDINTTSIRSLSSKLSEKTLERLSALGNLDPSLYSIVKSAVESGRLALGDPSETGFSRSRRRAARHSAGNELRRAIRRVDTSGCNPDHKKELLYVLNMELALNLFDTANELGGGAGNFPLVEANRLYDAMARAHPDRAIVLYRWARVLDALGDRRSARGKYEEMIGMLGNCDLPSDHWARCAVFRQLGLTYWEDGREKLRDATSSAERADAARSDFLNAFRFTLKALDTDIESEPDPIKHGQGTEREKAENNLLYYAVDFLKAGGEWIELQQLEFDQQRIRSLISSLEESTKGKPDHRAWDTLRHAYDFFGEDEKVKETASQVIEILGQRDNLDDSGTPRDMELLEIALCTIEKLEKVNEISG